MKRKHTRSPATAVAPIRRIPKPDGFPFARRTRARIAALAMLAAAPGALALTAPAPLFAEANAESATTGADQLRILLARIGTEHPRVRGKAESLAAKLERAEYQDNRYPDPSFGVAWSNYPYRKDLRLIDDQTPMTGVEFTLSQPIPFPGRLGLEARLADVDAEASRLELALTKNDLVRDFLAALVELRLIEASLRITESFAERLDVIAEVARARYSVGRASLGDVSQAAARAGLFADRARDLRSRLAILNEELRYFLQGDSLQEDAAETPLAGYLQQTHTNLAQCTAQLEERSLAAALAGLEIDRARKEQSLAKLNYAPDFEVFASYREREIIQNDPAMGEDFMSFGFKMRVPLWSALANHDNVDASQHRETGARHTLADTIACERRFYASAGITEQTARDRLQSYREILLPRAERAAESARNAYENGRGDFDAFLASWELLYSLRIETESLRRERDRQILARAYLCNAILPDVAPSQESQSETQP